jgi:glycosyltransferase involved in cell wall biosynthesis
VGGGETAPASFYADFGLRGRTYEYLRGAARRSGEWDPSIRKTARGAALALAVTQETRRRLLALGTRRVELFSAMGFAEAQYEQLRRMPRADAPAVRFVSIGRLLHWKGFHLGLKAFAAAALPEAEYWIVGEGPELGRLQNLVRMLGIQERVKFWGAMSRPEALNRLASCHVLVHPSLHDSGGWVCLEAMAGARPVICLDLGGPSEQVTDATGIRVPAGDPQQAVSDLAEAMTRLGEDVPLREAMGRAGQERVRDAYLWEKKGEQLDAFFATVLRPGVAADAS